MTAFRLEDLSKDQLNRLPPDQFKAALAQLVDLQSRDRMENQLLYYEPNSAGQRAVHLSRARVLGVSGGNRCLPLHALVLMADGSWKALRDVAVGDSVIAADPVTGLTTPSRVVAAHRSGRQPVYRITFSDGGSFEATADHMVPLYLGSGRKTTKGRAKLPHKRRLGDYIEPIMRRGGANPSKRISAVSPADIRFGNAELPLPPYLLGALIGDGGLSRPDMVRFTNVDPAILARVDDELAVIGCRLHHDVGCNYRIVPIRRGARNPLIPMLRSLGLFGHTAHGKFIPREVFGLSRSQRMQFLAGLVDTDGAFNEFTTVSAGLAEDFVQLVRSLGGWAQSTARETRAAVGGPPFPSFRVYFRLNEMIPLELSRKQRPPDSPRYRDYRRRICRSAELVGEFECGDITVDHPAHCYVTGDYVIVSNSGKTEVCLADLAMLGCGVFPLTKDEELLASLHDRFRGPINIRVVVESLTTTLYPTILPKLQFWRWSGIDRPGGEKGHWGWIPKLCLKNAAWDTAWTEKTRTLTTLCRDPENFDRVLGETVWQFMSKDQDPTDFASGSFHHVLHDEPPTHAIWRENKPRVWDVSGRLLVAMTWPDDPSIPVDWIYDEIYEPGMPGPRKDPQTEWYELSTLDNRYLNQVEVAADAARQDETTRQVRTFGKPIRFSNRIHPLFTDADSWWSFPAGKEVWPVIEGGEKRCPVTGSTDIVLFNHVTDADPEPGWPAVFVIDPHPRKPHMWQWVVVDPNDDFWCVAEGEIEGDCVEVRAAVERTEQELGLRTAMRLIDPNMGRSQSQAGVRREVTWQDEFEEAGLRCDLADDSAVGRQRLNQYLKPDLKTRRPRFHVHSRCQKTIWQLKRYVWDEYRKNTERDVKQMPRDKNDDYPTCLKYVMNLEPTFDFLHRGAPVIVRPGTRRGAY